MSDQGSPRPMTAEEAKARLLGPPASLGRREIGREAHVSLRSARRFWHALGFQTVEDDDLAFTEADQQALRAVAEVVRAHDLDENLAMAMTRAFARTAERLAVWQTQLVAESLAPVDDAPGGPGDAGVPRGSVSSEVAEAAAARLVDLAEAMEPLLTYAWRRHLSGAIGRMLADARPDETYDRAWPIRTLGFADLVSFTALVSRVDQRELAALVQRFEMLASDVVTSHGGRIIKTVGDEVLFIHNEPAPAVAIGLDLVDAMSEDDLLPSIRVGMAQGPVLSRLGDVFGTTVNRASRLTALAPPDTVWADEALASALLPIPGFTTEPTGRRTLRGIGVVTPHQVSRTGGARKWSAPVGHL